MPSYKSQYKIEQLNDNAMAYFLAMEQIQQQRADVVFEF
jgi:hypothetical protein